jgi:hypothetical protein
MVLIEKSEYINNYGDLKEIFRAEKKSDDEIEKLKSDLENINLTPNECKKLMELRHKAILCSMQINPRT